MEDADAIAICQHFLVIHSDVVDVGVDVNLSQSCHLVDADLAQVVDVLGLLLY